MELKDRIRKVDISQLTPDQADGLSLQIGEKCREICDEAASKLNAIVNIYGMKAKIGFALDPSEPQEDREQS